MNPPTIIVASIIAAIFVFIIVKGILDKKNGKSSCSCGGSCGSCGMNCHQKDQNE